MPESRPDAGESVPAANISVSGKLLRSRRFRTRVLIGVALLLSAISVLGLCGGITSGTLSTEQRCMIETVQIAEIAKLNSTRLCHEYTPWLRSISNKGILPDFSDKAVMNDVQTVLTFFVFGADLKLKEPSPTTGRVGHLKDLTIKSAKLAAGLGFILMALNGLLTDVRKWHAAVQAMSDGGFVLNFLAAVLAAVETWVLSPNFGAAVSIWSKLAIQSPALALGLVPKYEYIEYIEYIAGAFRFPKYLGTTQWLHWTQHIYAILLFPYILANAVFYPLLLPCFIVWALITGSALPIVWEFLIMFLSLVAAGLLLSGGILTFGYMFTKAWYRSWIIDLFSTGYQAEVLALMIPIFTVASQLCLIVWAHVFAMIYSKMIGASLQDYERATLEAGGTFQGKGGWKLDLRLPRMVPLMRWTPFKLTWNVKQLLLLPDPIKLDPQARLALVPFNLGTDFEEPLLADAPEAGETAGQAGASKDLIHVPIAIMLSSLFSLNRVILVQIIFSVLISLFASYGSLSGTEALISAVFQTMNRDTASYLLSLRETGLDTWASVSTYLARVWNTI